VKTKLLLACVPLGSLLLVGCAGPKAGGDANQPRMVAGVSVDYVFTISRPERDPVRHPGKAHDKQKITWKMSDPNTDGFDVHVTGSCTIAWTLGGATNFAILVYSADHWTPMGGCSWATLPRVGSEPAVLPTSRGYIYLKFSPGTDSSVGDEFHYKIAILGTPPGIGGTHVKAQSAADGSDDDDIVDTTIVWDGAVDNLKARKKAP
jgi:hypothetical protein